MKQGMKKFFVFAALFAFLGFFSIPEASAHRGPKHKTYKKAYKKGYKQGYRQAHRDEHCYRGHDRRYKRYRNHRNERYPDHYYGRRTTVYTPATVSVNIPLPPAPPLPPFPPLPFR